jgi:dienelactone hydrolase
MIHSIRPFAVLATTIAAVSCSVTDAALTPPEQLAQLAASKASAPTSTRAQPLYTPPAQRETTPSRATRYPVGTRRVLLDVDAKRTVPVQLWYPAVEAARAEAEAGRSVLELEPEGPARDAWAKLNREATPYYTQRMMYAADAPEVTADLEHFPTVVVSHCTDCLRIGYLAIAEELAAHGFIVAAPDHVDGTMYDYVNGTSVGLDMDDFLEQRRLDMFALTDWLLDPEATTLPAGLRGRADAERVGMLGHSFGGITAGYASTRDPRIRAIGILTMAVSVDNRLPYTGDALAARIMRQPLSKPALFVLAQEDIGAAFGLSDIVLGNFQNYPARAWLATLEDAGHYSVSNLCGILNEMTNGCGTGLRPTNPFETFTYLNLDFATDLTAQLVTTFFESELNGASDSSFDQIGARASSVLSISEHAAP